MATKHKGREKGDWLRVAAGSAAKEHTLENGRGLSNIPGAGAGSAAYRRLQALRRRGVRVGF